MNGDGVFGVESHIIVLRDLLHTLAAQETLEMDALTERLPNLGWRRKRNREEILNGLRKVVRK